MLHYASGSSTVAGLPSHHDGYSATIGSSGVTTGRGNLSAANELTNDQNGTASATRGASTGPSWEYEEITIERGPEGLGFTVAGGTDNPHYKNDNSIYITRLILNGPARLDGRLKLDDIIVRVNDTELTDVKHWDAVSALKNSGSRVQLLIKRKKLPDATNVNSSISNTNNNNISSSSNYNKNLSFIAKQSVSQPQLPRSSNSTPRLFTSTLGNFDTIKDLTRSQREVILQRSQKGLGFNIVGGIAGGGTFISYIVPGGAAERSGKLHCGDQVLSVNGVDLRLATHEEAAAALKQAGQTVKLVVKYRPEEYIKFENRINDLRERNMLSTGTLQTSQKKSLYARALFDYDPTRDHGLPSKGLPFKFGEILHIINASDDEWWQAKKVLDDGQDNNVHGIIPSKKRIEKRERAKMRSVKFANHNCSEPSLDRRRKRFSFSRKFPFMGSQSNSRNILSTSSTMSINNSEEGSIKNFNEELILSYETVLQQDINYARPVALYGPVKDEIEGLREELSCDDRFYKMENIVPYTTRPPKPGEIDGIKYHFVSHQEMNKHRFVEAGELNHHRYGTSIDSIREVAESGKHCLLNISPKAIKKLHEVKIFPIVIFIKPKSIESLMEMNKRWSHEEASVALDYANRLEQEFGSYFTATISQETPNDVLQEIMNVIAQQLGPRIWIPISDNAATPSYRRQET